MKKFFALLLSLTLVCSALAGCSASEEPAGSETKAPETTEPATETKEPAVEPITIRFACTMAETDMAAQLMQKMCDEIEEKTEGGIKCEFFPGGQLGTLNDILEMQIQGANIVCLNGLDCLADYVQDTAAPSGPFLFRNFEEIQTLTSSEWIDDLSEDCKEFGVQGLSYNWISGLRSYIGNVVLEKPSDFVGKQLRGSNTSIHGMILKSLGATHLTSNWNEVYTGLANGTYDAAEADLPLLYSSNLYEVTKYLNLTQQHANINVMWVNADFLASLPVEYQTIMMEASEKYGNEFSEYNKNNASTALKQFEEKGVEIHYVDFDEMAAATASVWDEYPGFSDGIYQKLRDIIEAGN